MSEDKAESCFQCELPKMKRGVYPCKVEISGKVVEFENPGWWCDNCQEGFHTMEDQAMLREKIDKLVFKELFPT